MTSIQRCEYDRLTSLMKKEDEIKKVIAKKEAIEIQKEIERRPVRILKEQTKFNGPTKFNVGGSKKHNILGNFFIDLLKKDCIKYVCEQPILLDNKAYRIDIYLPEKKVCIELGGLSNAKKKHILKHLGLIHLSYGDFKCVKKARYIIKKMEMVLYGKTKMQTM